VVFKSRCAGRGVVDFLGPIHGWSEPPHHVKVNPLGEDTNRNSHCKYRRDDTKRQRGMVHIHRNDARC
jgi:hypothetical protein